MLTLIRLSLTNFKILCIYIRSTYTILDKINKNGKLDK